MSPLTIWEPRSAESSPNATGPDQGVIEEARRRQRRRRTRGTIGAVIAPAVAGAVVWALLDGGSTPLVHQATQHIPTAEPAVVLAEEPHMGVSCPIPNSVACDRVGLGIELRTRAETATATIDGRPFRLDNRAWSDPPVGGKHKRLAGFLQPAGLLDGLLKVQPDRGRYYWIGSHPVSARVRIVVDYGGGRKLQTTTMVGLHAGWG
jgi:hypothetical protein